MTQTNNLVKGSNKGSQDNEDNQEESNGPAIGDKISDIGSSNKSQE